MNIILTIVVIVAVAAIVLVYKQEKKETHPDTPVDNTPTPIEDENVKPEKPKKV